MISFNQFLVEEKIDIDNRIKEQLVKKAENKLKKGDFWANKTPAEQEAALKEARKKAIDDYNNLPEEEKQKHRDKYNKSLSKKGATGSTGSTSSTGATGSTGSTGDNKKNKEVESKNKEIKTLLKKKSEDLTPNEKRRLAELKKDDDIDLDNLTSAESKKLRTFDPDNIESNESQGKEFLDKLLEIDKTLEDRKGVYSVMKDVAPNILTIAALCCPIAALAIGGTIGLGFVLASVFKACKKNDDKETIEEVTTNIKKVAKEQDFEDGLKEIDAFEKSAYTKDGEFVTDEDFELNLEKNGLKDVVKNLKKNKTTLEKEVDTDKVQQAAKAGATESTGSAEKLSNEQIEELQKEISNLDPEKDKDKINEITDNLKKAAKDNGKDESEYVLKTDKDENGNPRQRKTGPRGGKYYRVKGDDGWGPWNSDTNNESLLSFLQVSMSNINENKLNNLSGYLNKTITK